MTRFIRLVALLLAAGTLFAQRPGSISLTAPIHSMDAANTRYTSIRIVDGTIRTLDSAPLAEAVTLPEGAVIVPGFIDSHSHVISFLTALSTDAAGNPNWLSLANVNVMQLPECGGGGSTPCYQPVTTQAEVESLLRKAQPNSAGWVLGWNYEPSRLTCGTDFGFKCRNFENMKPGEVLALLDVLQPKAKVLVTSESGHIAYVNTRALRELNICSSANHDAKCHHPVTNPAEESELAQRSGQLDEDLTLYAISHVENKLADAYAKALNPKKKPAVYVEKVLEFFGKQIEAGVSAYSRMGYTTVQEGAASGALIHFYMQTAKRKKLPATVAFLAYDGTTPEGFAKSAQSAQKLSGDLKKGGYDMFVAGMKAYADGTNQGYTGDQGPKVPYFNLPTPFTAEAGIFPQPYHGLPDYGAEALHTAIDAAHHQGFPLWVHTNGHRAQANVVDVMTTSAKPPLRDVIVHFAMPSQEQVQRAAKAGVGATFLINDFYFFYQAVCEQILGREATQHFYPAKWAQESGMPFGIHSDASVTPPSPLFGMWVATERPVEHPSWLPPLDAKCAFQPGEAAQRISRLQALRAYTSDAAWLYGRDTTGSFEAGHAGDLVVLSADPLLEGTDLTKVEVLYTIHDGNVVYQSPKAPKIGK